MPLQKDQDAIVFDRSHDGLDRRGFLKCMAWAGTGALCVLQGGVLKSYSLSDASGLGKATHGELAFVQISDSHMGFNKPANTDVLATFQAAVNKITRFPLLRSSFCIRATSAICRSRRNSTR